MAANFGQKHVIVDGALSIGELYKNEWTGSFGHVYVWMEPYQALFNLIQARLEEIFEILSLSRE